MRSCFLAAISRPGSEAALQRRRVRYSTRMARSGNPNGGDDPVWSATTATTDVYLEIGAETAGKEVLLDATCDFLGHHPVTLAASVSRGVIFPQPGFFPPHTHVAGGDPSR